MNTNRKRTIMLASTFSLLALSMGTIEPVRPAAEIAPELEQTASIWLRTLRRFSPQMSDQQKKRLITLSKRTAALIGALLVALAAGYTAKRWAKWRTQEQPAAKPVVTPEVETPLPVEQVVEKTPAEELLQEEEEISMSAAERWAAQQGQRREAQRAAEFEALRRALRSASPPPKEFYR